MSILLQIIGYGWAALGVYVGFTVSPGIADPTGLGMNVIIGMVLFVLPGLGVGGIGSIASIIRNQPKAAEAPKIEPTIGPKIEPTVAPKIEPTVAPFKPHY